MLSAGCGGGPTSPMPNASSVGWYVWLQNYIIIIILIQIIEQSKQMNPKQLNSKWKMEYTLWFMGDGDNVGHHRISHIAYRPYK